MGESVKRASAWKAGETVPTERQRSLAPRRGSAPEQPARHERQRAPGTVAGSGFTHQPNLEALRPDRHRFLIHSCDTISETTVVA